MLAEKHRNKIRVVEIDNGFLRKPHYQICAHLAVPDCFGCARYWWSARHGWLPAKPCNVRHYSRFRSVERANTQAERRSVIDECEVSYAS